MYLNPILVLLICLFLSGCSLNPFQNLQSSESDAEPATNETPSEANFSDRKKKIDIRDASPFYPMDETVDDIQNQITDLKSRVVEYESRINRVALDPNLLQMIKAPVLSHEIELINGSMVQGSILQEDVDRIILKTQIGQIRIEKNDVISIKEIAPNSPDLSFNGEPEQKIFNDKRVFSGEIQNEGMRRADFTRIIFYLWDENTNLISSDSAFIEGSDIKYKSGIITDCTIESGASAKYEVTVPVPDTTNVRYITKEIHFSIYD
ncbi:MAG: hypothetical protein CMG59_06400 [Candidatus Marinimicrobia bacterium]|nr:hypothetical protein [Candidatus Neomarinimicrobiota bacterium]|tara:strand:+ start:3084 stop:3875 length:792 start_codon:yes stop_codon:yes gene_type:complete